VVLDNNGNTVSHQWAIIGGKPADLNQSSRKIEMIDFTDEDPQWVEQGTRFPGEPLKGRLYQTNSSADGVVLPNGKVLILGGSQRAHVHEGELEIPESLEERFNLKNQMFDPADGSVTVLAKTHTRRGLHGAALLLPDATVLHMGDNRHSLVPAGDRVFSPGDADLGVSNAYRFSPPYLFNADGSLADRPIIETGPDFIDYGKRFTINVGHEDQGNTAIQDVVIIRTDFVTHALATGNRYVKLSFEKKKGNELKVQAPRLPAQAIAGDHMLFVVDENGVPSRAKHIRLR